MRNLFDFTGRVLIITASGHPANEDGSLAERGILLAVDGGFAGFSAVGS